MNPVAGGWTSHKIKGDGDYEARKRAAMAQGGANSYIQGVQSVMEDVVLAKLLPTHAPSAAMSP